MQHNAAIVTIGSELVMGLRLDTNTRTVATLLRGAGYNVVEAASLPDDVYVVAGTLRRLCAEASLVVVTGGLGPTHDDVTREAAAMALDLSMSPNPTLLATLQAVEARHLDNDAVEQVRRQAQVLDGAQVIPAATGTAPGQIVSTRAGVLLLLPGPPSEMRPMLEGYLGHERSTVAPRILSCTGITESDAQVLASRALRGHPGVGLTVLAAPGDVQIILFDEGSATDFEDATTAVRLTLGDRCFSDDGTTLAQTVIDRAIALGITLGAAESCTGGKISSSLTDVPGSSAAFLGSVVSYSNEMKINVLGVAESTLSAHGAVSEQVASEMACGAMSSLGADLCVAVTGIAGPAGGSADKPVGLVWFAVAGAHRSFTTSHVFSGGRDAVRTRATYHALDLLRCELARM